MLSHQSRQKIFVGLRGMSGLYTRDRSCVLKLCESPWEAARSWSVEGWTPLWQCITAWGLQGAVCSSDHFLSSGQGGVSGPAGPSSSPCRECLKFYGVSDHQQNAQFYFIENCSISFQLFADVLILVFFKPHCLLVVLSCLGSLCRQSM